jgi:hypothetical protein
MGGLNPPMVNENASDKRVGTAQMKKPQMSGAFSNAWKED